MRLVPLLQATICLVKTNKEAGLDSALHSPDSNQMRCSKAKKLSSKLFVKPEVSVYPNSLPSGTTTCWLSNLSCSFIQAMVDNKHLVESAS